MECPTPQTTMRLPGRVGMFEVNIYIYIFFFFFFLFFLGGVSKSRSYASQVWKLRIELLWQSLESRNKLQACHRDPPEVLLDQLRADLVLVARGHG